MKAILCDICGLVDRSGYSGSNITYSYPLINGVYYPEDLCDKCTQIMIDTLTLARNENIDKARAAVLRGKETRDSDVDRINKALDKAREESKEDDNNPATQ